jgi:GTP pyrophosphokinase
VKTPSARSKIRSYFSKVTKADDSAQGRDVLARELRKLGLGISTPRTARALAKMAPELGFAGTDDLFVAIGSGKSNVRMVASRVKALLDNVTDSQAEAEKRALSSLTTAAAKPTPPRISRTAQNAADRRKRALSNNGVIVAGSDVPMLVRLAHCCNPVIGDDIVGFVTRGSGVSVHRSDCPNVADLRTREGRMIDVEWDLGQSSTFQVEIVVEAVDRTRLLADITMAISDEGGNILSSGTNTDRTGISTMRFLVEFGEVSRFEQVFNRLHRVEGVLDARRALPGDAGRKGKHRG